MQRSLLEGALQLFGERCGGLLFDVVVDQCGQFGSGQAASGEQGHAPSCCDVRGVTRIDAGS